MKRFALYLLYRLASGLVMIWVVASFTFFLVRAIPGDPVAVQMETNIQNGMSLEQAQREAEAMYGFAPHAPLPVQYVQFLWRLLHLDLGRSISYNGVGVGHILMSALPWTVFLVTAGIVVTFVIGVIGGVLAAVRRDSWIGSSVTLVGSIFHGIPQYMTALILAYFLATRYQIFPFGAPYDVTVQPGLHWDYITNLAYHAILPIAAFVISGFGFWALAMKSSVVSTLGDDFILASELRGIKPSIRFRYIARNAFLPLFTVLAISLGFMFGGAIFIERIFDYPGLGNLLQSSVTGLDYPLMDAAFLLITVAVIVFNILADLLYTVIDPRIRTTR